MTDVLAGSSPATARLGDPSPALGVVRPPEESASIRRPRRPHGLTVVVMVIALATIAVASILARSVHQHTEQRLLDVQAVQAGSVLTIGTGNLSALLSPAAELAASTGGDLSAFESTIAPQVGDGKRWVSAAIWDLSAGDEPVQMSGREPALLADRDRTAEILEIARASNTMTVAGLVGDPARLSLGLGVSSQGSSEKWFVYVESLLPESRRGVERSEDAFANIDYAIYLGDREDDEDLLASSVEDLPMDGRRSSTTVPFGNTTLRLVVRPVGTLSGGLSQALPWIVVLVGLPLSLGFAGLVERLLRRRDSALETFRALALLSDENARLYAEQLGIAETLQRSLLPDHLPSLPRATVAARYWPAGTASEVGGDFYDLFELGDDRWGLAIGDVCGKGVSAAALTGVARHTIQAGGGHVESPAEVLHWVHEALRSKSSSVFCTVCFGVLTLPPSGRVRFELSLGGHPPPLLCRRDGSSQEIGTVGTVLGIIPPALTDRTYELDSGDTLILFTDGLTDAPHDTAVTMREVEEVHAEDPSRTPDEVADELQRLIEARRPLGSGDDTALLIVRIH